MDYSNNLTPKEINISSLETSIKHSFLSSGIGCGSGDTYSIQSGAPSVTSFEKECIEERISYQKI